MEELSSFPLDYAMHCYNSCNTQVPHMPSIVLPTQVSLQVSGEKSTVAVILKQLWEIRISTIKISGLETFVTLCTTAVVASNTKTRVTAPWREGPC